MDKLRDNAFKRAPRRFDATQTTRAYAARARLFLRRTRGVTARVKRSLLLSDDVRGHSRATGT
eukprot:6525870-Lingulodinium_polyedra.AAC.1